MAPSVPPRTPKLHKTFQEVKIHTAKCDECNKHNKNTIYRCVDCNSQCCTPCWDKKGGDGKHVVDSALMTNNRPFIVSVADAPRRKKVLKETVKIKKAAVVIDEDDDVEDGPSEIAATTEKLKVPRRSKKQARSSKSVVVEDSDADEDDALDQPVPVAKKTVKESKKEVRSKHDTVMYDNDSESSNFTPPPIPYTREIVNAHAPHATPSNPIVSSKKILTQGNQQDLKRKRPVIGAESKSDSEGSKMQKIGTGAAEVSMKKRRISISRKAAIVSHHPVQATVEEDAQDTDILANYLLDFSRGALAAEPSTPLPASHEENRHAGQLLDVPTQAKKGRSASPESQLSSPVHMRELKTATPGAFYGPSTLNNTGLKPLPRHRARTTAAIPTSHNGTDIDHAANKKSQSPLSIPKPHSTIDHPSSSMSSKTHDSNPASPTHRVRQSYANSLEGKAPRPQLATRTGSPPTTSCIQLATTLNGIAQTGEGDLTTSNSFRFLTPLTTAKEIANDSNNVTTGQVEQDDDGEEEQEDEYDSDDVEITGEHTQAGDEKDDLHWDRISGRDETDDEVQVKEKKARPEAITNISGETMAMMMGEGAKFVVDENAETEIKGKSPKKAVARAVNISWG